MTKQDILDQLDIIFERIDSIGFIGTNEHELHLKDEIADYVLTILKKNSD